MRELSFESNLARESELYVSNTKILSSNVVTAVSTETSDLIAQIFVICNFVCA